jgi:hypothetical protein
MYHNEIRRLARAVIFLIAHAVILVVLLLCVMGVEAIMHHLGAGEHKMFDKIPLSWIFDASEVGLIAAFAIAGGRQAWRRFNDEGDA